MLARRRGFTLIELLVVIAIIGILAAMLFPVFARARESARKIQCLSNVKNIALAYQMYLTDYDKFPPSGKGDARFVAWLDENCGCRTDCAPTDVNPYCRIPVILDEYIKNRDVWRCPSAKFSPNTVAGIQVNSGVPDWFTYFLNNREGDCPRTKLCNTVYPPGWGGDVTDSTLQGTCGFEGAFNQSIGTSMLMRDLNMSVLRDVSKTLVCADAGVSIESDRTSEFAYPDQSRFDFLLLAGATGCSGGEGGNCSSEGYPTCGNPNVAAQCSPLSVCYGGDGKFTSDVSYRKTFARHMGGSNIGFADGHAKWMDAEAVLFGGYDRSHYGIHPQLIYGVMTCFNPTNHSRWDKAETNDPTAAMY